MLRSVNGSMPTIWVDCNQLLNRPEKVVDNLSKDFRLSKKYNSDIRSAVVCIDNNRYGSRAEQGYSLQLRYCIKGRYEITSGYNDTLCHDMPRDGVLPFNSRVDQSRIYCYCSEFRSLT